MVDECQEPNCVRPAKVLWQGSHLCADCYEKYQAEYNRMLNDMPL